MNRNLIKSPPFDASDVTMTESNLQPDHLPMEIDSTL